MKEKIVCMMGVMGVREGWWVVPARAAKRGAFHALRVG